MPALPFRGSKFDEDLTLKETMSSKEKNKVIKRRFYVFAEEVSIIGVRATVDQSRSIVRRLVWALLVLFGIGLAIYQVQERIFYYLSYPTTTKVNINDQAELKFPQVTICNENMFRAVQVYQLGNNK